MLSAFVQVSSTKSGSIEEVIVTEQVISCISPTTPCKSSLGWKEILGRGAKISKKYN